MIAILTELMVSLLSVARDDDGSRTCLRLREWAGSGERAPC